MSESPSEPTVTIKTETPDSGPAALRAALFCWGVAFAIVIGDVLWFGFPAAFDVRASDFFPLALIFALVAALAGTFFLFSAVRHTLRFRKYGSSVLEVNEARLGGTLWGSIRTERDLAPLAEFTARLRCDRSRWFRDPGARQGGYARTELVWESVRTIAANARPSEGLPIEFAIPESGLASGSIGEDSDKVSWTLEVTAPLGGIDYHAEFPVKVKGRGSDSAKRGSAGLP